MVVILGDSPPFWWSLVKYKKTLTPIIKGKKQATYFDDLDCRNMNVQRKLQGNVTDFHIRDLITLLGCLTFNAL